MADRTLPSETRTETTPESRVGTVVLPPRRPRRWPWVLLAVVAAAVALWALSRIDGSAPEDEPVAEVATGEVVRTDLVEVTDYSGTLGRVAGDPVTSSLAGTVTAAAAPGDVVGQGDSLFEVDGDPVTLALGDQPAYRAIAPSAGTVTVATAAAGTVTAHADVGDVLRAGDVAYVLGDVPTVVLYGDTPAWRILAEGADEGPDIRQLEQALVDLGYDPDGTVTIDDEFTGFTEAMVERWQEDLGVEDDGVVDLGEVVFVPSAGEVRTVAVEAGQSVAAGQVVYEMGDGEPMQGADVQQLEQLLVDLGRDPGDVDGTFTGATRRAVVEWQTAIGVSADGVVDLGEIVFLPDPIRISERLVTVGSVVGQGTAVLAATGSEIRVTMDLPAEDQGLIAEGEHVEIELPDGTITPGTVETVDTVATVGTGALPSGEGVAVFEVTIVLDDPDAAAGLDEAPVDIAVITDRVDDVLAVPVTALLALAEGGYAVEVVDAGGGTRLVAVDPGFYAEGLVEIDAEGLSEGDQVVVP